MERVAGVQGGWVSCSKGMRGGGGLGDRGREGRRRSWGAVSGDSG